MKKIMLSLGVLFLIQSAFGQTASIGNWILSANVGIEAHDKRLFNYARPEREALLRMQPEFWGTYHLGFHIQRTLFNKGRLAGMLGVGFTFEKATFDRPFNHLHFDVDNFLILRHQNDYKKYKVPISYGLFFEINERWSVNGAFSANFLFFRSIGRDSYSEPTPYREGTFGFCDINGTLGIFYKLNNILIGFNVRAFNFQKIDKIIFNSLIKDPRTDQTWEWYNPLRFDLTVGYTW